VVKADWRVAELASDERVLTCIGHSDGDSGVATKQVLVSVQYGDLDLNARFYLCNITGGSNRDSIAVRLLDRSATRSLDRRHVNLAHSHHRFENPFPHCWVGMGGAIVQSAWCNLP
jgi:hypothetical protein